MKKNNTEKIYYFLLSIYIINQVFSESQFINIRSVSIVLAVVRYMVMLFLMLIIVYRNIKLKRNIVLIFTIMFVLILLNIILVDGGISYLLIILFVLASKGYSMLQIFKSTALSLVISHSVVCLCAKIGILQDITDFRYIGKYSGSVLSGSYYRHNMGFLVHNQIALSFFIVYLYVIAIKRKRLTVFENACFLMLNFLIFFYFGSRIAFLLTLLVCMMFYLVKSIDIFHLSVKKKIWKYSYILCASISIVSALAYRDSRKWNGLNMIFNNRIILSNEAIKRYGINILGAGKNATLYSAISDITVDNGYISVLIGDGVIVAIILIAVWTLIAAIVTKKNNKYLLLPIVLLAVENLINTHLGSFKLIPFFCILLNSKDAFLDSDTGYYFLKKS